MNTRAARRCVQVLLAAVGAIGLSGAALLLAGGNSHPVAASTHLAGSDSVRLPPVTPSAGRTTTAKSEPSPTLAPLPVPSPAPSCHVGCNAAVDGRPAGDGYSARGAEHHNHNGSSHAQPELNPLANAS